MESRQYTTFYVGSMLFGVEVYTVQEVIRFQDMTPVPLAARGAAGLINLRGEVVTAIDLRVRFGLPPLPEGQTPMNVVVRVDDEPVSLLVDSIGDVAMVSADQFEDPPETLTGIGRQLVLGAYKLEDRLLLTLDIARAVELGLAV
jgi:purine-binding chemotaxis protein CheW